MSGAARHRPGQCAAVLAVCSAADDEGQGVQSQLRDAVADQRDEEEAAADHHTEVIDAQHQQHDTEALSSSRQTPQQAASAPGSLPLPLCQCAGSGRADEQHRDPDEQEDLLLQLLC